MQKKGSTASISAKPTPSIRSSTTAISATPASTRPFLQRGIYTFKIGQIILCLLAIAPIYLSHSAFLLNRGFALFAVATGLFLLYTLDFVLVFSCAGMKTLSWKVKFTIALFELTFGTALAVGMGMYNLPGTFTALTGETENPNYSYDAIRVAVLLSGSFNVILSVFTILLVIFVPRTQKIDENTWP